MTDFDSDDDGLEVKAWLQRFFFLLVSLPCYNHTLQVMYGSHVHPECDEYIEPQIEEVFSPSANARLLLRSKRPLDEPRITVSRDSEA